MRPRHSPPETFQLHATSASRDGAHEVDAGQAIACERGDEMVEAPGQGSGGVTEAFFSALAGLDPIEMRVVGLVMSRAADLEAVGRSADADSLLLGLLRIVQERGPSEDFNPEGVFLLC